MRETRKQLCPLALQFCSQSYSSKLQQTSSRSGSRSQGFSRQVRYHCLSVWRCRGQRWHQHGYTRNVILTSISRLDSRSGGDSCRWSSPRWYGCRSWMRQKYARCLDGPSVFSSLLPSSIHLSFH